MGFVGARALAISGMRPGPCSDDVLSGWGFTCLDAIGLPSFPYPP